MSVSFVRDVLIPLNSKDSVQNRVLVRTNTKYKTSEKLKADLLNVKRRHGDDVIDVGAGSDLLHVGEVPEKTQSEKASSPPSSMAQSETLMHTDLQMTMRNLSRSKARCCCSGSNPSEAF